MFFKKENINELIYKHAKLSSDVSYSLKQIERGDKNKVEIIPWDASNTIDILENTIEISDNNKCQSTYLSFNAIINGKKEVDVQLGTWSS
jgi:hypothetical protein